MSNTGLGNLDDLFQSAQDDGLTDDTLDLLISNLNGPTMATAVGVPLDQLGSSEVTLAMNIIDMSGSMAPYAADLMQAYNDSYLGAMNNSIAAADILVSAILFNENVKLLHGYVGIDDAIRLTVTEYDPYGGTALYDAVAGGLTNMVLYAQQLRQSGVMVRCIVIVYPMAKTTPPGNAPAMWLAPPKNCSSRNFTPWPMSVLCLALKNRSWVSIPKEPSIRRWPKCKNCHRHRL
ncbi:MAG: hypothetical protein M5U34_14615 [Chloroflexi bacterium]|nr:hypothetical protein [Chloroflexota bacterium]